MVERVTSGIPGLDELVEGGIPDGSVTLISGGTGSGKTTFCSQFLWAGLENGETCLFITTEELPEEIKADAAEFGWNFSSYEADENFFVKYIDPSTRSNYLREDVEKVVTEMEPDRVVIDSISVIGAYWSGDEQIRSSIHHLVKGFREMDATVLITGEMPDGGSGKFSRYGIAEFVVDGVVALGGLSFGESTFRSLQVIKMRQTAINESIQELQLTGDGIRIEEPDKF